MSTESIVSMLIAERDKLSRAIQALGGEVSGGSAPVKRLGRTAKTATVAPIAPAKKRVMSSEGRNRQIEAMKKYWAAKKAAKKKSAKS